MSQLVAVLSGPEKTRAKVEVALEHAHLSTLPADHHAIGRRSYGAEHWDGYLPADDDHGFIAVLVDGADELNRAVAIVEKHGWVLRVHYELPAEPKADPLRSVLEEYERRIAHLERRLDNPPMRGGALESPPFATQAGSFGAEQTRRAVFAQWARTGANTPGILLGGLLSTADCQIAAPVSGMSVNVSSGEVIVGGTEGGTQGGYYGYVSSTTNLTISTANPSNPRIDTVCATVADAAYTIPTGGTSGAITLQVVTGTPTSGATLSNLNGKATLPGSSLLLGYVLVPASATNIISADIANVAAAAQLQAATDTFKVVGAAASAFGISGAVTSGTYTIRGQGTYGVALDLVYVSSPGASCRVRSQFASNAVAPTVTFTVGLYPATFAAGSSGANNTYTFGTVVSGSTVTFTTPSASSSVNGVSTVFPAPAAGMYMLGVHVSANAAANSTQDVLATLELTI